MAQLAESDAPIVSASAGNFGQGLAYAAAKRGRHLVVFASMQANPIKLEAMRRLGAKVTLEGNDFDAAKAAARLFAKTHGFMFVEDGGDRRIAEGAGTIAKEITETAGARDIQLDAIVVPLGNGALITGVGTWMRAKLPSCRVIGVVAEAAPAMKLSWESGSSQSTLSAATIADGIAIREPVDYALASMTGTVDEIQSVTEAEILSAVEFCRRHYGLVVEPAGAVGIAAVLADPMMFAEQTAATVLCGSNVFQAE